MIRFFVCLFFSVCFCQRLSAQGNYFSLGIGPSLIYADNSGNYHDFKFKVQPAFTLSVSKQINEHFSAKGSIGAQMFKSGDYKDYNISTKAIVKWGDSDQAFDFKGTGYFVDAMPIFTTNPNELGMLMSSLQFYAGLGFGVMFVDREEKILKNGVIEKGQLVSGDLVTTDDTSVIPYVPVRTGFSTNTSSDWDFALEFVLIVTTNSELDGNNIKDKSIRPDMSGQIQLCVKRYFGKNW